MDFCQNFRSDHAKAVTARYSYDAFGQRRLLTSRRDDWQSAVALRVRLNA